MGNYYKIPNLDRILFFLIVATLFLGSISIYNRHSEKEYEKFNVVSDTSSLVSFEIIQIHDTVITRPIEIRRVDSILIKEEDKNSYIPIEQKHYRKDGIYDVWISGYKANLDSLNIFQKVKHEKIIQKVFVRNEKYGIYAGVGFNAFCGHIIPSANILITSPKKVAYMANLGSYNGEPAFGFSFSYKLNNR